MKEFRGTPGCSSPQAILKDLSNTVFWRLPVSKTRLNLAGWVGRAVPRPSPRTYSCDGAGVKIDIVT